MTIDKWSNPELTRIDPEITRIVVYLIRLGKAIDVFDEAILAIYHYTATNNIHSAQRVAVVGNAKHREVLASMVSLESQYAPGSPVMRAVLQLRAVLYRWRVQCRALGLPYCSHPAIST
jgi:hypothetical protein